jgi:hypothetical protein
MYSRSRKQLDGFLSDGVLRNVLLVLISWILSEEMKSPRSKLRGIKRGRVEYFPSISPAL